MEVIKSNETSQKLIAVALSLFREHGYEAATINQICEGVGISKNTFYYYFKSKEELLLACMGSQKSLSMSELTTILLTEKIYFEQFWILQKRRIDFVMSCGSEIMRNIGLIHAGMDTTVGGVGDELQKIESAILQKAQEAGEIGNHVDARSLSLVGNVQFLGTLALWISMDSGFEFEDVLRSCLECCYDVKPELRKGRDLYTQLIGGMSNMNEAIRQADDRRE
jgi:AcrR family transcriptional regulator